MEHLCSTPASVHEKVGCRLSPSHRTLSISSRPSSAYLFAFSLRNSPRWALILIKMVKRPKLTLWCRTLMILASISPSGKCCRRRSLPSPGYCHESFGIREYHNELVMSEGVFNSQTRCRKFGPAGRAATDASPDPAALTSFGIVSVKTCSHSCATFQPSVA